MPEHTITHTVCEQYNGGSARAVLSGKLGISRQLLTRIKRSGEFYINEEPALLKAQVKAGDTLRIVIREEKIQDIDPEPIPLTIIFEDEHLLVVDKPAGLVVHPTKGYQSGTLANAVINHWREKGEQFLFRPVHRLDRDTSGLVVVAKNPYVQEALTTQHLDGRWQKTYTVIVMGKTTADSGLIDAPIHRVGMGTRRRVISDLGQPAQTLWKLLKTWGSASLVEATLVTGRTHQIRAHFAHIGHPLVGDDVYGEPSSLIGRQALHAGKIRFMHPITAQPVELISPLPQDMRLLLEGMSACGAEINQEDMTGGLTMGKREEQLQARGVVLPPLPNSLGNYIPANRVGNLVYTSGQGSRSIKGYVGGDLTIEEGYAAAREAALRCLTCLQAELGTLDKVEKVFKVLGFVRSAPGFSAQPAVMNGASDLFVEVFGDAGRHARSAIGVNELPEGIAVEVEIIVAVKD
ncbi:MAG TPA: RluA family pseudouridine synthase [Bacillota bacterium]|nr:RluA family pseudouridine synthase [Bacillota bacterium]